MADGVPVCSNASCEVRRTGVCLLGNDPIESCPEYVDDEIVLDEGEVDEDTVTEEEKKRIPIRTGEILSEADLVSLRMAKRTTIISLVGDVKVGKTTLIAALYQQFCKGAFAGCLFRSSQTLTAFAKRHHHSLLKSGLELPQTPRTSMAEGVGFLHLNLLSDSVRPVDLVISDRSGEAFQAARINTSLVEGLGEFRIADRICFLLDADRLTDHETRARYKREFKQMIWALLHNADLSPEISLEVLVTKIDKLSRRENEIPDASQELKEFEDSLIEELRAEGYEIGVFRICALPSANYAVGLVGIEDLLKRWLGQFVPIDASPMPAHKPARYIDRLVEIWGDE